MGSNQTWITEFILLGFQVDHKLKFFFFGFILLFYILTMIGNAVILGLICLDSRLHTPMYFFLSHLAIIDMSYSSSTLCKLLTNLVTQKKTISFAACILQTFMYLILGIAECLILVVMSYDRYVAICHPLHYSIIMSWRLCIVLTTICWTFSFILNLVYVILILRLPFCGPQTINHFFCQIVSVVKLACDDTSLIRIVMFVGSLVVIVGPLSFLMVSYTCILMAILRIQSGEGRKKAFSTCSSHLCVVGLYFGGGIAIYLAPKSSHTQRKVASLLISLLNPMLNPLIYSLRNTEVKGSLRRFLRKKRPV